MKYLEQIENEETLNNHKCNKCTWGTYAGLKFKCALPRCMPKLGDFYGVKQDG